MDAYPSTLGKNSCQAYWDTMDSYTTNILNWYDLYRPKYDVTYP
jgi:hypothetical protein